MATKKKDDVKKADKQIVFDPSADRSMIADQAIADPDILAALVESLSGSERRIRQFSAAALGVVAESDAELLKPYAKELADALHRPEAQTRWEILEALTRLVEVDARSVDRALDGTEASLHDEDSGVVRLAAFRLLCAYGATTEHRAERVWPLIDEAIQCYHGDAEFPSMLVAVIHLVSGKASAEVRKAAADRMRFDAQGAKGLLKRRAGEIVAYADVVPGEGEAEDAQAAAGDDATGEGE